MVDPDPTDDEPEDTGPDDDYESLDPIMDTIEESDLGPRPASQDD